MIKFKAYYNHDDLSPLPYLSEIGVDYGPYREEKMLSRILPNCYSITQEQIEPDIPIVVLKCYGTLEEWMDARKKKS